MENESIVRKLYNVLLHRDPDSDGMKTYLSKLEKKVPLFKLIQGMSSSEEFIKCQLKLIKSNSPSVFELQNYIEDHNHDLSMLSKRLQQNDDLFLQNCQQLELLQKENQKLKELLKKEGKDYHVIGKSESSTQTDHEYVNYELQSRSRKKLISKVSQVINVFMCVRNNENSLETTFNSLLNIQKTYNVKMNFYIYENDSSDSTPYLIIDFYRRNSLSGAYSIEKISKKEWTDVKDINRSRDMAMYRNNMKDLCKDFSQEYSLIIDTDVEFTSTNFFDMLKLLKKNKDIAMVTPYAYAGNTLTYYDTYALDSPKKICVLMPEIQEVYSAFGGFVLIRSSVLKECHWDIIPEKLCSEHNYFCNMVRSYGKVVIARDIRVHWNNKFT